jgi:3-hydroxyisobutyrate dehydrogenase
VSDAGEVMGFIGLGNMGGPMAANLAQARAATDMALVAFDVAGTAERAPQGTTVAGSVEEVAQAADVVLLSLPDGGAVLGVARALVEADRRRVATVVDLSTIGIAAGRELASILAAAGIDYLEAPVSGGVNGAKAATLSVMAAGEAEVWEAVAPLLEPLSANRFLVGKDPGQGQAMKVLNNFLSATAMAATSEAFVFGERHGLNGQTMLDVLNASSGQNTATRDKFPRLLEDGESLGFRAALLSKDVSLYLAGARASDSVGDISQAVGEIWTTLVEAEPDADFSAILRFTRTLSE